MDRIDLEQWAEELGLSTLLDRALEEAGKDG
jgi:hypothetical protein